MIDDEMRSATAMDADDGELDEWHALLLETIPEEGHRLWDWVDVTLD